MINQMNQNENTQNQFSNAFKELQLLFTPTPDLDILLNYKKLLYTKNAISYITDEKKRRVVH